MIMKISIDTGELSFLLLQVLIEVIQKYLLQFSKSLMDKAQSQFILIAAESSCQIVVKILSKFQQYHEICYKLLELCITLLVESGNSDFLPHVSSAFYNVAGLFYKSKLECALVYAQASEDIYNDYLKEHRNCIDSWINMVKKQDLVASILLLLSRKYEGIRKWEQIIESIPWQEWIDFSDASSKPFLLKTIQRYVKAASVSVEEYKYVVDLIQNDSFKDGTQYNIMDFELRSLVALHELMNTSKLQIPLLNRMLDVTSDQMNQYRYLISLLRY